MSLKPPVAPNVAVDNAHVFDETTALPVRDGLVFAGAGVTATDDANNNRTTVTIPGGTVGSGGEPYTAVDALSGNPRAETNWGPILNTAITNGARRLLFGPYDYPFSTTLSLAAVASVYGLVLEGTAGRNWNTGAPPTRLLWTAAGSGIAVDMRGPNNEGTILRDLGIYYNNAGFTGTLISQTHSGGHKLENCSIAATSPGVNKAARCLVDLDRAVGNYFENCIFNGAQALIRGYVADPGDFSNTVSFRDCVFASFTNFAICNPGFEWLFDGLTVEFDSCGATAVGIGGDVANTTYGVFTVCGETSFWDYAFTTQRAIKQPVGVPWDIKVHNTTMHGIGLTVPDIDLQGPGTVHISDTTVNSGGIALGDVALNGANSRKDRITLRNVDGSGAITQLAGHGQVQIENIGETTEARDPQLHTLGGYERVIGTGTAQRPTIALHSGASGWVIQDNSGTDMAGVIRLTTQGTPTAGLTLDVTFGSPMYPDYRITGYRTWLAVQLTPVGIDTIATDGDIAAGLGLWAQIANVAGDPMIASTGFSIGVKNAPVAGKNFAIAYRVVQL